AGLSGTVAPVLVVDRTWSSAGDQPLPIGAATSTRAPWLEPQPGSAWPLLVRPPRRPVGPTPPTTTRSALQLPMVRPTPFPLVTSLSELPAATTTVTPWSWA